MDPDLRTSRSSGMLSVLGMHVWLEPADMGAPPKDISEQSESATACACRSPLAPASVLTNALAFPLSCNA